MCCEYLDLKYQGGTRYLLKLWGGKASKVDIFEAEARNPTIRVTPDEREIVREVFLYLDEVSRYEYAFSVNLVSKLFLKLWIASPIFGRSSGERVPSTLFKRLIIFNNSVIITIFLNNIYFFHNHT